MTVQQMLAEARQGLERLTPEQAEQAAAGGEALLIDIRAESQRARDGVIPGAVFIARNVIEWRCDPSSEWREESLFSGQAPRRLVVMCDEGYQSSLVAATLQRLGHPDATDMTGGFQAWRSAGLPVEPLVVPGRGEPTAL